MIVRLLLCDVFEGILPPSIPSYSRMFENLFDSVQPGLEYRTYRAYDRELPSFSGDGVACDDLFVVTGSRAGVYDSLPWIEPLAGFIREAHRRRASLAGICFGHQMIAQALGGRAEKFPDGKGSGIRSARIVGKRAAARFPESGFKLAYSHGDQVTRLPEEAENFAEADHCPFAGFTIGNHVLTFQGHPEFGKDFVAHLLAGNFDELSPSETDEALSTLTEPTHHAEAARWMLSLSGR